MARCDFNLKNKRRSIRDFKFLIKKTKKGSILCDHSLAYLTLSYAFSGNTKEADKYYDKDHVKHILKKLSFLIKRNNQFKSVYLSYLINHRKNFKTVISALKNTNFFRPSNVYKCLSNYFTGLVNLKTGKFIAAENDFASSSGFCSDSYKRKSILNYGISKIDQKKIDGLKYIKYAAGNINYHSVKISALKYLVNYYGIAEKEHLRLKYLKRLLFDGGPYLKNPAKYQKLASKVLVSEIKKCIKKNNFKKADSAFQKIAFLIPVKYINPLAFKYFAEIKLKEIKEMHGSGKGKVKEKSDDFKEGLKYAKKYYNLTKTQKAKYFMARFYYESGKYEKSLSLLNKINLFSVKNRPLKNKITLLKLNIYKKLKRDNDYIDLLKKNFAVLSPQKKVKLAYKLAVTEFNQNNIKASTAYFKDITGNKYSKDAKFKDILNKTHYYLGVINYKIGNPKVAMFYFKKAYEENPIGNHFQYELSQIAFIYLKDFKNKKLALNYYKKLRKTATSSSYKSLAASMIEAIKLQK